MEKHVKTEHRKTRDETKPHNPSASMHTTVWHWRDLWSPDWIALLVIGIGLIMAPYFRGLYFDSDMMVAEQVLCFLLLMTGMWKWAIHIRATGNKARWQQAQPPSLYTPRHLFIFAVLFPYVIGLWTAVAPYDNWLQLFRYVAYGLTFFIVAEVLSRKHGAVEFLQVCMQISIGWTALFAVATALGQVTIEDAVLSGRLSSVFQYPNTFGIILAVGIVGGLLLTLRRQWWLQAVGGLFLIPMGYVFLLTLSRGAWLFFPVVYLLGLLLLPMRLQWAYLIHSVLPAVGVGILLLLIGTNLGEVSAGAVWTGLLVTMAAGAAGYLALVRYVTYRWLSLPAVAFTGRRWALQLVIPAVLMLLVAGALYAVLNSPSVQGMLPDALQTRVAQIDLETHSVLERGYFNQDALEIYRDYPVFGAGGGGWRALFQKYQDYPYWSTQSHNFFSQLMVETGTFGVLLFAGIFLYYVWRGFRWYIDEERTEQRVARAFFLVVLFGLLGHSAIDFNMSFGYVGFLIFLSLAGWQSAIPTQKNMGRSAASLTRRFRGIFPSWPVPMRFTTSATFLLLLLMAGIMFFPIHNYSQAEAKYKEVGEMLEAGDVSDGIKTLEQIIQRSPYNPSYHLTYGSVLISVGRQQQDEQALQQGIEHIKRAAELASTHPQQLAQAAHNLMRAGEAEDAFHLIQQALKLGTWDIQLYPLFMEMSYEVGEQRLADGKEAEAAEAWKTGIQVFEQVSPMRASLDNLPNTLNKGRSFGETDELRLWAGKLHYRLGEFQAAIDRLTPLQESENEDIQRPAIVWGMAAQLQIGVPVEQTVGFDVFVQHPDWGNELRQILTLDIVGR